jgi:uncharacterized membrane protein
MIHRLMHDSVYDVNMNNVERLLSVFAGSALLFYGLTQRTARGLGMALAGGGLVARGASGHSELYSALGVNTASEEERSPAKQAVKVTKTVTVDAPAGDLYRFWRNFENLPRFMRHLQAVQVIDERRSHWVTKGPAGMTVAWDAEIINEVENEHIAWQSTEPADLYNAGSVHFHPVTHRGTEVRVVIRYTPPAGALGVAFAKLFGEAPSQQVAEDLRRFKSLIEAGEIPTTAGQPVGPRSILSRWDVGDAVRAVQSGSSS